MKLINPDRFASLATSSSHSAIVSNILLNLLNSEKALNVIGRFI